ncbi:hypothetical protein SLEP1_g53780 [Rubroshorea leprosula]|uniref:Uncharacterized protein n=1 Tax=Rubroshorea leprosula TaxID=152421 RepID=A0AAV5MBH8_9ROSI|nr:hypothetical protein SLEP1_g53780 [Rubroshorea leprosula]
MYFSKISTGTPLQGKRLHLFLLQRVLLILVTSQVATHGILQWSKYIHQVNLMIPVMLTA